MLVADEDVLPKETDKQPQMPAFLWMVNITDETRPFRRNFQVEGVNGKATGRKPAAISRRGNHRQRGTVRVVRAGAAHPRHLQPHSLREVASYMPDPSPQAVCSNDVFQDKRGLIYLIDRFRGMHNRRAYVLGDAMKLSRRFLQLTAGAAALSAVSPVPGATYPTRPVR